MSKEMFSSLFLWSPKYQDELTQRGMDQTLPIWPGYRAVIKHVKVDFGYHTPFQNERGSVECSWAWSEIVAKCCTFWSPVKN